MKIGLRIPGRARELPFEEFCRWCASSGFQAIDVGRVTPEIKGPIEAAGLVVGTADLPGTGDLMSPDAAKREAGVQNAIETIRQAAENGVNTMFCVFVPPDGSRGRRPGGDRGPRAGAQRRRAFPVAGPRCHNGPSLGHDHGMGSRLPALPRRAVAHVQPHHPQAPGGTGGGSRVGVQPRNRDRVLSRPTR